MNEAYLVDDPSMEKYLKSCVDSQTGIQQDCLLQVGDLHVKCSGDPMGFSSSCSALAPCPSQPHCTNNTNGNSSCTTLLCQQYTIETVPIQNAIDANNNTNLGYVPSTQYCHTNKGKFSQDLGVILLTNGNKTEYLGDCYFGDGVTLVHRDLAGAYAYCDGAICNTTFVGGWDSFHYDPRFRPWYIGTKAVQIPNWSDPYAFSILSEGLGITYCNPIYETQEDGKQVFTGVLAVDYTCKCFVWLLVYGPTFFSFSRSDLVCINRVYSSTVSLCFPQLGSSRY